MSTLVEKLRTELAEKEKKQRAMGRALADLKKVKFIFEMIDKHVSIQI